jgi:DNA-binding MarR family transcriptional regulator
MTSPDGVSGPDGWFAAPLRHDLFAAPEERADPAAPPADAEPPYGVTPEGAGVESVTAETLPDPLAEADLATLLTSALEALRAESLADLSAAGYVELDPLSARAFAHLKAEGGCTSGDLAQALELPPADTTRLLKDLERRGYLRRDPSPRGPRHVRFVLTDRALQQLRASGYVSARLEARLGERMGPEVLAELRYGLIRMIRS